MATRTTYGGGPPVIAACEALGARACVPKIVVAENADGVLAALQALDAARTAPPNSSATSPRRSTTEWPGPFTTAARIVDRPLFIGCPVVVPPGTRRAPWRSRCGSMGGNPWPTLRTGSPPSGSIAR